MVADIGNWFMLARTVLVVVPGSYLGLLYLGWAPTPYLPHKPRHSARRGRPTWTESPLYHALGIDAVRTAAAGRVVRRAGASSYDALAKLSRFTRQITAPGRTVKVVRSPAPDEEITL